MTKIIKVIQDGWRRQSRLAAAIIGVAILASGCLPVSSERSTSLPEPTTVPGQPLVSNMGTPTDEPEPTATAVPPMAAPTATPVPFIPLTSADIQRITPDEALTLVERDGATLYDTRTMAEYQALRAAGAVPFPEGEMAERFGDLPTDQTLIFY